MSRTLVGWSVQLLQLTSVTEQQLPIAETLLRGMSWPLQVVTGPLRGSPDMVGTERLVRGLVIDEYVIVPTGGSGYLLNPETQAKLVSKAGRTRLNTGKPKAHRLQTPNPGHVNENIEERHRWG